jgi:hypothetical protein
MVIDVEGTIYRITLSRDDAGNYVVDAAREPVGDQAAATILPVVRVVDSLKERAMRSLRDSLARITTDRRASAPSGDSQAVLLP